MHRCLDLVIHKGEHLNVELNGYRIHRSFPLGGGTILFSELTLPPWRETELPGKGGVGPCVLTVVLSRGVTKNCGPRHNQLPYTQAASPRCNKNLPASVQAAKGRCSLEGSICTSRCQNNPPTNNGHDTTPGVNLWGNWYSGGEIEKRGGRGYLYFLL